MCGVIRGVVRAPEPSALAPPEHSSGLGSGGPSRSVVSAKPEGCFTEAAALARIGRNVRARVAIVLIPAFALVRAGTRGRVISAGRGQGPTCWRVPVEWDIEPPFSDWLNLGNYTRFIEELA